MNTIQKYAAGLTPASRIPQAAQTLALLSSSSDKRQSCSNDWLSINPIQILHIKLFYTDGREGEMNISSPHNMRGEDLERQYIHMRDYLDQSAHLLGLAAYQGNMAYLSGNELRIFAKFSRVECRIG